MEFWEASAIICSELESQKLAYVIHDTTIYLHLLDQRDRETHTRRYKGIRHLKLK
jgi:hypothetical protein